SLRAPIAVIWAAAMRSRSAKLCKHAETSSPVSRITTNVRWPLLSCRSLFCIWRQPCCCSDIRITDFFELPQTDSEIAVPKVGLAPERRLQHHRFPPRVIHALHHLSRVAALCKVGLDRNNDRGDKRDDVAGAEMSYRVAIVRLVLFRSVMP